MTRMIRFAAVLVGGVLVVGLASTIPSIADGRRAPPPDAQPVDAREITPADLFARWLDARAEAAVNAGARVRAQVASGAEARRRIERIRSQVLEMMGGIPGAATPLNARITGGFARDGYRVEHLVFESLPGLVVTANVYVPTDRPGPFPAVVGTAGHSDEGKAAAAYQHVWVNLARRGAIVLAYDPPAQGERFEAPDPATGKPRVGTRAHTHVGQQCLLTGSSLAAYFVRDGMRAIDYLLSRSDVDPSRIAVAGNSGGGTQASWLAIAEPRLTAIVSSCYITSWTALWRGPGPQDMEQVLPGFLANGLDFPDMIAAAAPRPYLVSSAIHDFFPIEGARASAAEAARLYGLLDAPDRVRLVEHDEKHGWSRPLREAAYRWLEQWKIVTRRDASAGELPVNVEDPAQLRASSAQTQSRHIFDFNRDRAHELARTRRPATVGAVRQLLGIPETLPAPSVARREPGPDLGGLRTERLALIVEDGLAVPALLVHPAQGAPRGTVVVADGRDATAIEDEDHAAAGRRWAERGYLALVLHVRGAGVLAPAKGVSGYSGDYQLAARAWLLGTSVVAWQTRDLLAALAFVEQELPGERERIVHVAGSTAPAGVFAAALHRVTEARIEGGLVSYLDLAETRDYTAPARLFVPGVLETTDLPEVMALAAPATVHLMGPVDASGRVLRNEAELAARFGGPVPANVRFHATPTSD